MRSAKKSYSPSFDVYFDGKFGGANSHDICPLFNLEASEILLLNNN